MRILLDENIPVQLKPFLVGHEVRSVNDVDLGWKNIKNGKLLTAMEGRFDILITADKNLFSQQNMSGRKLSIIVLPTNRRREVLDLAPSLLSVIEETKPGQVVTVDRANSVSRTNFP